jgi:hypothetical protein
MPDKTFAQGWATVLAMDRAGDERGVIRQRPDDGMLLQERQRLLRRRLMLKQLAQRAEAIFTVPKGRFTGMFEHLGRMLPG